MSSKEECARSMGHRSNDAAEKDVQIKSTKEECAGGMGNRSNNARREREGKRKKIMRKARATKRGHRRRSSRRRNRDKK